MSIQNLSILIRTTTYRKFVNRSTFMVRFVCRLPEEVNRSWPHYTLPRWSKNYSINKSGFCSTSGWSARNLYLAFFWVISYYVLFQLMYYFCKNYFVLSLFDLIDYGNWFVCNAGIPQLQQCSAHKIVYILLE